MKWIPKFRFSLRTLFIVTTLLGVFLVPLVVRLEKARKQKEAVAWVLEHGGTVYYEVDEESGNFTVESGTYQPYLGYLSLDPTETRTTSWLEDKFGTDFVYPIVEVKFFKARYPSTYPSTSSKGPDLSPLSGLHQLERFQWQRSNDIDLTPLSQITSLREIDLYSSGITDIRPLAKLKNLESIEISRTRVSDISAVSNLKLLKSINLSSSEVTDLSPLSQSHNLESIDLSYTRIKDLSPLAGLTQLKTIKLSYSDVTDISALKHLTQLQLVDFSYTDVSDISPLANSPRIETLVFEFTPVEDISSLNQLQKLDVLNFSDTNVSDISVLSGCKELNRVEMVNTPVTDLTPLAQLPHLMVIDHRKYVAADRIYNTKLRELQLSLSPSIPSLRPSLNDPSVVRYTLSSKTHLYMTLTTISISELKELKAAFPNWDIYLCTPSS